MPAAGIAGYAFTTGQQLADRRRHERPALRPHRSPRPPATSPRSILATPLTDADGTLGVLEVLDRRGGTFTLRDLEVAGALRPRPTIVVRRPPVGRRCGRAPARRPGGARRADDAGAGEAALDEASIEALVSDATLALPTDPDDPDLAPGRRIARLRDVDPDRVELATDWLDALLRRRGRRPPRLGIGPGR